ncbi:MAG: hypothetical protein JNK82_32030 [Myxococcaceae bacterium]|nr:hypothetical protein [Myxococcaceae bacterium]
MNETVMDDVAMARRTLTRLGFAGPDIYLAELIPAIEMAWADGTVHPDERALLEAYCDQLVAHLNGLAGAPVFSGRRARGVLDRLLQRRLLPHERQAALVALKARAGKTSEGLGMLTRAVEWAEAVAAVSGCPVWDTRELFWLQNVLRTLQVSH